jgi:limonene-1,2-epoxide hydrolase
MPSDGRAGVRRLEAAVNAHDLEAVVACFGVEYVNETPAHPARGFRGREQVRRNWAQIFGGVADLEARLCATAVEGATVWTEWEHRGTRADGSEHCMRGVVIFEFADELIVGARFYLEPVDSTPDGIDATVRAQVAPGTAEAVA